MTSPAGGDVARLFVALPCAASARASLDGALAPVRDATSEHLRWVRPDTWHLTLAFLGDVEGSRVDLVTSAIVRAAAGHAPFDVSVRGASRFGRGVLFLAVDNDAFNATVALGDAVRRELREAGVWFDDKPLHPHLTLARQRDRRGRGVSRSQLDAVEAALGALGDVRWPADEVVLFRSHLGEGPVRHERVAAAPLS